MGALDITLYRDDLTEKAGAPIVRPTEIPFSLKEKTVLLVDDVLYTGRTIRAALDALLDHGRPRKVLLAALVDRGGRELPIQGDFTGAALGVEPGQRVSVRLKEIDGEDGVSATVIGGKNHERGQSHGEPSDHCGQCCGNNSVHVSRADRRQRCRCTVRYLCFRRGAL